MDNQSHWSLRLAVSFAISLLYTYGAEVEPKVELPPFVVYGVPDQLPWQYARYRDFEILTLCPPSLTRDFVESGWRGSHLLPSEFIQEATELSAVILYDTGMLNSTQPEGVWTISSSETFGSGWTSWMGIIDYPATEEDVTAANLSGRDRVPPLGVAHLARKLAERRPRLPAWVEQSLFGKYGAFTGLGGYGATEPRLRIGRFVWIENHTNASDVSDSKTGPDFLPMARLFTSPSPDAGSDIELRLKWERQIELFGRWQLLGGANRKTGSDGFWRLAYLAADGATVDEALFAECIGQNYRQAQKSMESYFHEACQGPSDISIKPFPKEKSIELRPASEVEVARLKGNFERLEAKRLRASHPALAAEYEAAARRTLKRGLKLGANDPAVRGVLGLLEYDTGHPAEARPHLEAAFTAKAAGSRALLALARLRLTQALDGDGRLPADRLAEAFAPVASARERTPALLETYHLVADIWASSVATPQRGHLAVLLEGVRLFPQEFALLRRCAELHARFGFTTEAEAVVRLALQRAGNDEQRRPFAQLLSAMSRP